MVRLAPVAILGWLAASSAVANPTCDDLWFSRNLNFHEAGYCFGSELGKAVFGNAGCTGTDVELSDEKQAFVARVREAETELSCQTNTDRDWIEVDDVSLRMALLDQPIAGEGESACLNWLADPWPLWSGHRGTGFQWGQIEAGDDVYFGHQDEGPWSFVIVYRENDIRTMGWTQFAAHDPSRCAGWAG